MSYQEYDVPDDFPLFLRQYIPNNYFATHTVADYTRYPLHFSWDATEGLVIVNVRGIFHLYTKRFLHTGLHERWY